ncbi:hypothetical protein [Paludibacterium yongneupense]|uniref:hypothetical protein n=1 Tax=Paludibacterium yongneupense TaxID=400061 RepID=UPI0004913DF2|nr:hypothetical protein [Paludibacterium yongneupense]
MPYETEWWRVSDWCGQRIHSKTALPLLRDGVGGPAPLAAAAVRHDARYRHWQFKLRDDLRWDDARRLTAEDYRRTIRVICRDPGNRFRTLLSDLAGFAAYTRGQSEYLGVHCPAPDRLACDLGQANRFFAHLLCAIALSPMHPVDPQRSAGPYRLLQRDDEGCHLGINPHFCLEPAANAFGTLHFRRIAHDGTASAYSRKHVDVSADTALVYPLYAAASLSRDFYRCHDGMMLLLAAGGRFTELAEPLRRQLTYACDRETLRHHLHDVPAVATSYHRPLGTGGAPDGRAALAPASQRIRIAYEDFYPNRQIVEELRRQWARHGWSLEAVQEGYGQRIANTHLRLEIRVSLKSTPLLLYRADLARGLLPQAADLRARELYTRLTAGAGADDVLYAGLDTLLQAHGIAIPLLELPQGFFVREGIDPDSVFRVGSFVSAV